MKKEDYKRLNDYLNDTFIYLSGYDRFFIQNMQSIFILNNMLYGKLKDIDLEHKFYKNNLTFEDVYELARNEIEKINSNYLKEFDKLIENCGNILMLPDEEIYDINKFNKLLKKELAQINLDEEIKIDKNINDIKKLLDKRKIIKHIYIMLEKEDYNKKIINTIVDIFSKEYLIALYLKSIK